MIDWERFPDLGVPREETMLETIRAQREYQTRLEAEADRLTSRVTSLETQARELRREVVRLTNMLANEPDG